MNTFGPIPSPLLTALRNFLNDLLHSGLMTLEEVAVLRATLQSLEEGILALLYPKSVL